MFAISETLQTGFQKCCASTAMLLNLGLIYLIINKSPKELGAYKYLMVYISLLEMVYALVDVLVLPIFHHSGYTFLIITRLESSFFDRPVQSVLSGLYCGLYGSCMALLAIHFFYRYLVIKGSKTLSTFRSWKLLLWFAIPILYGSVWGAIAVLFCGQRGLTDRVVETDVLENLDLNLTDIVYIAPYLFNDEGGIYWPVVCGLIVDLMIIGSSMSTVVYFGVLLFKELQKYTKNNQNLSEKNKSLQTQLYYSLVTQTLIPVILLQVPVSILFTTVFCSFDSGALSSLVSMTIALYPAIDPLPTMFIVTSYRNAISDFINGIFKTVTCRPSAATGKRSAETTKL